MRRLSILIAAMFAVALVATPAFAAENSVYDWWSAAFPSDALTQGELDTDVNSTTSGAGYYGAGYTAGGTTYKGVWHNGDAFTEIRVELAGWRNINSFGWYGWDLGTSGYTPINDSRRTTEYDIRGDGSPFGLYEIFPGTAGSGATWTSVTNSWFNDHSYDAPEMWGFYIHTNHGTWFSEWAYNDRTSYADQRHLEVFDHPGHGHNNNGTKGTKWVLCWEDLRRSSWDTGYYDGSKWTTATWQNSEGDTSLRNDHNVFENWGSHFTNPYDNDNVTAEPDYQDMILTFERFSYQQHDWDDSPELGTWALLACTGVFGGLLRRRRRED